MHYKVSRHQKIASDPSRSASSARSSVKMSIVMPRLSTFHGIVIYM